jgi:hypothetical protein
MLPVVVWVSQLRQFAGAMQAFLPNRSPLLRICGG